MFIYIKGLPGTGKITVARILKRRLGYRLFWFHDVKNSVYRIVGEHRIPHLMNDVTEPIVSYLLKKSENVIYVRPSANPETVSRIKLLVEKHDYQFYILNFSAPYKVLVERVSKRKERYRISSKKDLDNYLKDKPKSEKLPGEYTIFTHKSAPEDIAEKIIKKLRLKV